MTGLVKSNPTQNIKAHFSKIDEFKALFLCVREWKKTPPLLNANHS